MQLLRFLIVGLIAGWLASRIMKRSGSGLTINLLLGVIGSAVGGLLFSLLNLAAIGMIGEIIMSTIGAIVLIVLLTKFVRPAGK